MPNIISCEEHLQSLDDTTKQYVGGLLDGCLVISSASSKRTKVVLSCDDEEVIKELSIYFPIKKLTIVKRPAKKDVCVCQLLEDTIQPLLQFAGEWCVLKKEAALASLVGKDPPKQVEAAVETAININWCAGLFDVRALITSSLVGGGEATPSNGSGADDTSPDEAAQSVASSTTGRGKKKRGNIKLCLGKNEKFIIPQIKRILSTGKVQKNSPCRIIFESKEQLKEFKTLCGPMMKIKKEELRNLLVGAE
jgi:hypothetical protein